VHSFAILKFVGREQNRLLVAERKRKDVFVELASRGKAAGVVLGTRFSSAKHAKLFETLRDQLGAEEFSAVLCSLRWSGVSACLSDKFAWTESVLLANNLPGEGVETAELLFCQL
jgi:hypothetical protein